MSVKIKVDGLDEIAAVLQELPKSTGRSVLRRVLLEQAQPVVDVAKSHAPVRTGRLRDSLTASAKLSNKRGARKAKQHPDDVIVHIGIGRTPGSSKPPRYGHMVEFGTVHSAPEPFMRPAWDFAKANIPEKIKDDLWREITKVLARRAKRAGRG